MIILAIPFEKSMKKVVRLFLQPSLWLCLVLALAPFSTLIQGPEDSDIRGLELTQEPVALFATSPGHTVFGEYVGAHWCGPCMDSASPSLINLKSSNPEDFTYVSFFESSSGGWPNDSPIDRQDHIMSSSDGYPTFSFADSQSGTCYKVGSGGTSYYDADFSNGGCMSSTTGDFELSLSMILNSTTEDVSVTLEAIYTGSESSVDVFVYGAITEKIGADAYDNGVKPHHNWRGWLLDSSSSGFQQLTLLKDTWTEHTWETPLSQVRATAGYTQWENFWPVLALMDGPHTSYNEFFAAIDPDMGPMVDVGISEFTVENANQMPGFIPGDILGLDLQVTNNGVEPYSGGGDFGIFLISGSEEIYLGGESIGTLGISETTSLQLDFDTSGIESVTSGVSTFRAKLTDLGGDRNSSNDVRDEVALHDLPPTPSQPAATGSTSFERGDEVTFETSAIPNDLVDDINTMTPKMEYSKSGSGAWDDSWLSEPELVGSGANAVYVHSIQTPPNAEAGHYDTRVMWEDASGQQSDWLLTSEAFELKNALPRVLSSQDPGFAGTPAVKIDTLETVSLNGLVSDAETPLSPLSIDSDDPEFKGWNPATSQISVQFETIENDQSGNPIPQGIFIFIDDGEDINSGMLQFNVIENGAPRWSPIPTQPVFEGESASTSLTRFLTDFDDEGQPLPASDLTLSIVSNSNEDLLHVSMNGHTITAVTTDDDSNGVAEVTVMAHDGAKSSQTSVTFFVINVNDAPSIDLTSLKGLTLKSGEQATSDLLPLLTDIDDPDEEIWVEVVTSVPGSVQFDYLSGVLNMLWQEPGSHTVSLTLIDSHGDWSESHFTVIVLDSKPIIWKTDFQDGDLEVSIDDMVVGGNPMVTINNVGSLELSETKTRWSICNSIVGVCHSAGAVEGLGPFQAAPVDGGGMSVGDYLTLSIKAVDSDGWDRETEEILEILLPTTSETPEEPTVGGDQGQEQDQSSEGGDAGFSTMQIIAGILIVIVFLGGGALVGLYLSGYFGSISKETAKPPQAPQFSDTPHTTEPTHSSANDQIIDFEKSEPHHPPLPEGGLPEGWTMEQWKYYGEQWLERNQ